MLNGSTPEHLKFTPLGNELRVDSAYRAALRQQIKDLTTATATASPEHMEEALTGLVVLARRSIEVPSVLLDRNADLVVRSEAFRELIIALNQKLFLQQGEYVGLYGSPPEFIYGKVQDSGKMRIPYLGKEVVLADINFFEAPANMVGKSSSHYAFIDRKRAERDGKAPFQIVTKGMFEAGEPFHSRLQHLLRKYKVTEKQYSVAFGVNRFIEEEVAHAKDHVFLELIGHSATGPVARARALLKPSSKLLGHLDLAEKAHGGRGPIPDGIMEHSARVEGLRAEILRFNQSGLFHLALCAFYDFAAAAHREDWDYHRQLRETGSVTAYALQGNFWNSAFAELKFKDPYELVDTLNDSSAKIEAQRCLDLVTQVLALDFWSHEERSTIAASAGASLHKPE